MATLQTMNEKWTALYVRLSRDDENEGDSNSIAHQDTICQGYFRPKTKYPHDIENIRDKVH